MRRLFNYVSHAPRAKTGSTAFVALVLAVLFCSACGYRLVGTGSTLPEHISRIAVRPLTSRVYQYNLEQIITAAIIDEFNGRSQLKVVSAEEEADAVLAGEITGYRLTPTSYRADNEVDEYRITITAKISFRDDVKKVILWEEERFSFHQDYYTTSGNPMTNRAAEEEAWEKASENFAERLVSIIVEGF